MSKYVFVKNNTDGTCSVTVPTPAMFNPKSRDRLDLQERGIEFKSDEEIYDWIQAKDAPGSSKILKSELPEDRVFRNAWNHDVTSNKVKIDFNKAVDLHKNKLRELRTPKLAALDVEMMRAIEDGDQTKISSIKSKKQALRDITNIPSDIKTVEALKTYIPKEVE